MKWLLELHIEIKSYLIMEWLCRHCSLMAHLVGGWGNEDWVGILHPLQQGSIIFGCFRYVLIVTKGHNWTKNAGANMTTFISQIVRISEDCDQNGDRVSKNDESCHICIMWKKCFSKIWKIWDSVYIIWLQLRNKYFGLHNNFDSFLCSGLDVNTKN